MCIYFYRIDRTRFIKVSVDDVLILVIIFLQLLFPGQDRIYKDGVITILLYRTGFNASWHLNYSYRDFLSQSAHPFDKLNHKTDVLLLYLPGRIEENFVFRVLMQELCALPCVRIYIILFRVS